MVKYTIKRILLMLFTFFVIMLICFTLIKLLPLQEPIGSEAQKLIVARQREIRGYNKPILEQFFIYWKRVFTKWDWGVGETYLITSNVAETFAQRLPSTMLVNIYSIVLAIPLGILLGIFAALKKNKWQDQVISTGVMIFISVPSFVLAFLMQYTFYFKLGWIERATMMPITATNGYFSWATFKSLILPVLSMSFGSIAGFTRITRAELTEVLTSDFMLLARTQGLTKTQAIFRHALRNCAVVIVPAIMGEFIGIMSGSLVIESIFGIPGVGKPYLDSITAVDYNFFMMLSAFYIFIGLLAGIIVDISYGFIDPRIRMGGKK